MLTNSSSKDSIKIDNDLVSGDSQESSSHLDSDDDSFGFGTETCDVSDATVEVGMCLADTFRGILNASINFP